MSTHAIFGALIVDMATDDYSSLGNGFAFQALSAVCYPFVKSTVNFLISNGSLLHCLCYFVVHSMVVTCVKRKSNLHTVHETCSAIPHRVVLPGYI